MIATTEKKIAVRKAPIEKANMYEEGFTAIGSDGLKYVVKTAKNGFKRWMKEQTQQTENIEPEPETFHEAPSTPEKPKRAYTKKMVKVTPAMMEQGTQTDVFETPKKPKKEPKMPAAPKKA